MGALHPAVNVDRPEIMIRNPADECWLLSGMVVLRPEQAATQAREPAPSPTGAEAGGCGQGASQRDSWCL